VETLGLSDGPERSESRLKSLLWPSIQSGADVDYLGVQGYWICTVIAVASCGLLASTGQPLAALATFLLYYLGGFGVREHNRFAALVVFVVYAIELLLQFGIIKVLIAAILLSNIRATWIAAEWKPESEEAALPPRFSETWGDKLADQLPQWLWPKVRVLYYVYAVGLLVLLLIGLIMAGNRIGSSLS
jgi:hypothetical protein